MSKVELQQRDDAYSRITTTDNWEKQESYMLLNPIRYLATIRDHIFGADQLDRIRIIHNHGFIAKGTFLSKPAIMRLSNIHFYDGLNIYGFAIRYWDEELEAPVDILSLQLSTSNTEPITTTTQVTLPDSVSDDSILVAFYNGVRAALSQVGFVPDHTCLRLPYFGKTCTGVNMSTDKTFDELITGQQTATWSVSLKTDNPDVDSQVGIIETEKFNTDPNFGYNLRFNHNYLIPFRPILPNIIDQIVSSIAGLFLIQTQYE